jgi:tetratricopeptide (TPR) repeat protein
MGGAQETAQEEDVAALMEEAVENAQMGELDAALEAFEKVLEAQPEHERALLLAARVYSQKGVQMAEDDRKAANKPLRRGAELMRRLAKLKKDLTESERETLMISIYNEACCLAIDGEADKAIERLKEAIEAGFEDPDFIENDSDFDSLRNDERYKAIIADLRKGEGDEEEGDADDEESQDEEVDA